MKRLNLHEYFKPKGSLFRKFGMQLLKTLIQIFLLMFFLGFVHSSFAQDQRFKNNWSIANQAYSLKDYNQAIQDYQTVINTNPNYGPAYEMLGNCFYLSGRFSEALATYENALRLNPSNAQLAQFIDSLKSKIETDSENENISTANAPRTIPSKAGMLEINLNSGIAALTTNQSLSTTDGYIANGGTTVRTYGSNDDTSGGLIVGFDGSGTIGLYINPNFSITATISYYTFSCSSSYNTDLDDQDHSSTLSQSSLEFLLGVKYRLGVGEIQPYFLASTGLSDYSTLVSGTDTISDEAFGVSASNSSICPMLQVGLGVEYPFGNGVDYFFQTQLEMIFTNGFTEIGPYTFSNLPAGTVSSNNATSVSGGIVAYIPIQMGLNFNL